MWLNALDSRLYSFQVKTTNKIKHPEAASGSSITSRISLKFKGQQNKKKMGETAMNDGNYKHVGSAGSG